jgi:hypothetical protein
MYVPPHLVVGFIFPHLRWREVAVFLRDSTYVNEMTPAHKFERVYLQNHRSLLYCLAMASHSGDMQTVKYILERANELRLNIDHLSHALTWASSGGHKDVARLLLVHGADLQYTR